MPSVFRRPQFSRVLDPNRTTGLRDAPRASSIPTHLPTMTPSRRMSTVTSTRCRGVMRTSCPTHAGPP